MRTIRGLLLGAGLALALSVAPATGQVVYWAPAPVVWYTVAAPPAPSPLPPLVVEVVRAPNDRPYYPPPIAAPSVVRPAAEPAGPGTLAAPAGVYSFRAPAPVMIRTAAGSLSFTWGNGDVPVPPEPPVPAPGPVPIPEPPVEPPPVVPLPVPPAKLVKFLTMIYDAAAMTPGVASIRADRASKDKMKQMGVTPIYVDRTTRMPSPREHLTYYEATGLDRALAEAGVAVPAIVTQAADGSVVRVRPVPQSAAAAQALLDRFMALPADARELKP